MSRTKVRHSTSKVQRTTLRGDAANSRGTVIPAVAVPAAAFPEPARGTAAAVGTAVAELQGRNHTEALVVGDTPASVVTAAGSPGTACRAGSCSAAPQV